MADKPHGEPVLRLPLDTARMLRRDLEAAGVPEVDASGRVFDFHALRHTFISRLVEAKASVKVTQELARHSTPTLTFGRYTHTRLHDMTGALEDMPSEPEADDRQAL